MDSDDDNFPSDNSDNDTDTESDDGPEIFFENPETDPGSQPVRAKLLRWSHFLEQLSGGMDAIDGWMDP